MRVVISIGGAYFADAVRIKNMAAALDELVEHPSGCGLYAVTGGGAVARHYIAIARELGANEAICDYIGIALTRVNARLLISALRNAYPEPFYDYTSVRAKLPELESCGKIAVMGGVTPGYTTDAVSAILAEYINADLLLNVTTVDGVYDVDPRKHPNAKRYSRLTAKELVRLTTECDLRAGSRIVIDPVAAKIIERSGIRTVVLDGSNPRNIIDVIINGRQHGTEIT